MSSAGFWPGSGGVDFPAFYSYAYPTPHGFSAVQPEPEAAYFDNDLGEFLLPYDAVRRSNDPEATLMSFLDSTYRAALNTKVSARLRALSCGYGVVCSLI